jgi:hypothetical protein
MTDHLRSRYQPKTRLGRKPSPAARPRRTHLDLEQLEVRETPAVYNVNSLLDLSLTPGVDAATGRITGTNTVTLRSAIQAANQTPGGNTINLTIPGTYQITLHGTAGETDNLAGEFSILPGGGDLTIQNASGGKVVVDANHLNRAFDINANFDPANPTAKFLVTLQGFTIQNGFATDTANPDGPNASGGGIRDTGNASLTLTNVVVTNNTATADGGGVVMENVVSVPWTLTTNNTVISNNHAGDAGGGIDEDGSGKTFINAGTVITGNTCVNQGAGIWLDAVQAGAVFQTANLTITGAVISDNTAQMGLGGGIGNAGNGVVTITGSTIAHNFSGVTGGGFGDENAQGVLVVQNSLFLDNSAVGDGGGIQTGGPTTTITASEIKGNSSSASGGGIFANGVTLTVLDSTVAGNTAPLVGGGLEIQTTGTGAAGSTITSTTITGNSALNNAPGATFGGGLDFTDVGGTTGTLTLLNDTINANSSLLGGGLTRGAGGVVTVQNTIIAGNQATNGNPDFLAQGGTVFTSQGGNLVGINNAGDTTFNQAGDQVGTAAAPLDPLLGPLGNNGGPTVGVGGPSADLQSLVLETEALLPGSPALHKGNLNGAPTTDGRGFTLGGGTIDVGAFQTTATPGTTPFQRYVAALYQILLHRPADAGAAGWVSLLQQGVSPAMVALDIESSTEYRSIEVQNLFQHYLHRSADPVGLQAFVSALGHGMTVEQLGAIIVASPEYFQLHGGTNTGFVTGLFQDALNRAPDNAGLAAFTNALNSGLSRSSAASILFSSPEYFFNLVGSDYQTVLGRAADPTGATGFVLSLVSGLRDEQVLAALLGSGEAFARLT